jgi:hypothetical protein
LVRGDIFDPLLPAAQPMDIDPIDAGPVAEAELQP